MPHRIFGGNASQLHNHVHHLCHFALDIFHSSTREHLPAENRAMRFYFRAGVPNLHNMSDYFADMTEAEAEAFHIQCQLVGGTSAASHRQESKAVAKRPLPSSSSSSNGWPPMLSQLVWSRFGLPALRTAAAAQPLKREQTPSWVRRRDAFVRAYKLFATLRAQRVANPVGAHV